MRIAIVAPPWLPVPPSGYGGTEAVVDGLARGFVALGHEVLLFTTGDSTCPVPRAFVHDRALGVDVGTSSIPYELVHVIAAYEALADFDIVHDHTQLGPLYASRLPTLSVVTTNHGTFDAPSRAIYRVLAASAAVVAISRHQASTAADVPIAAVIHHGVELADFPVGDGGGDYALFLGRIHPSKGVDVAIAAARAAGVRLRIAGRVSGVDERAYFAAAVAPHLGPDVEFLGEVDSSTKLALLGGARCLLNTIAWPEPFGMVMIEALACATPVVTMRRGSAPELIDDGVTGFVCDDAPAVERALSKVASLDRAACRDACERRFSIGQMARAHISLYERLLEVAPGGVGRIGGAAPALSSAR